MINPLVDDLAEHTGVVLRVICWEGLGPGTTGSRALARPKAPRPRPSNALSAAEQACVLEVLTSGRFADKSVTQTWATLLDEGPYVCSQSTMHRLVREHSLYVVLDIFSRYVVAWTVIASEDPQIAKALMDQAVATHGAPEAVHADRGTSMTPYRWRSCWSILGWPGPIPGPTSATIIRTAKRRLRP